MARRKQQTWSDLSFIRPNQTMAWADEEMAKVGEEALKAATPEERDSIIKSVTEQVVKRTLEHPDFMPAVVAVLVRSTQDSLKHAYNTKNVRREVWAGMTVLIREQPEGKADSA